MRDLCESSCRILPVDMPDSINNRSRIRQIDMALVWLRFIINRRSNEFDCAVVPRYFRCEAINF